LLFSAEEQACGPEARALRGKSIGGKRIPAGDPILFPQREAGLSGAPEFGIRDVEFGILLFFLIILHSAFGLPARSKKCKTPHGFFAQRPCFRAGQCLKFNRAHACLPKSEDGQDAFSY
jgi:hypothetical protein